MNARAQSQVQSSSTPSFTPAPMNLVQRECGCGGSAGLNGECAECQKEKLVGENTPLVQPKLKISQPNDKYEQEADRVADEVMRMPEPRVQRQVGFEEEEDDETVQTKPIASQITPLVQRQVDTEVEEEEDEDLVQAKTVGDPTLEVAPVMSTSIQSLQNGGRSLSPSERSFFEPRLGTDFSNVRVHYDSRAVDAAQAVNARAFTTGLDVVFGAEQYAPETSRGQWLLAHELTHVVQQNTNNKVVQRGAQPLQRLPRSSKERQVRRQERRQKRKERQVRRQERRQKRTEDRENNRLLRFLNRIKQGKRIRETDRNAEKANRILMLHKTGAKGFKRISGTILDRLIQISRSGKPINEDNGFSRPGRTKKCSDNLSFTVQKLKPSLQSDKSGVKLNSDGKIIIPNIVFGMKATVRARKHGQIKDKQVRNWKLGIIQNVHRAWSQLDYGEPQNRDNFIDCGLSDLKTTHVDYDSDDKHKPWYNRPKRAFVRLPRFLNMSDRPRFENVDVVNAKRSIIRRAQRDFKASTFIIAENANSYCVLSRVDWGFHQDDTLSPNVDIAQGTITVLGAGKIERTVQMDNPKIRDAGDSGAPLTTGKSAGEAAPFGLCPDDAKEESRATTGSQSADEPDLQGHDDANLFAKQEPHSVASSDAFEGAR